MRRVSRLAFARRLLLGNDVARGTVGTLVVNLSATGLNFLTTLVLTHALGASGFGVYAFAIAWSTVLTVPAALGMSPLIIRGISRYQVESEWGLLAGLVRHSHRAVIVSSVGLIAIAGAVGALLTRSVTTAPFLIALLLVPIISLTTMRQAAMQGLGRVTLGRVPDTVMAPAAFLLMALILSRGLSAAGAVSLQVIAYLAAFVVGLWLLRRTIPAPARRAHPRYETREWRSSTVRLTAMSLASALTPQVSVIALGALASNAVTGTYQAASRTALFVSFLFMAAGYAVMPAVSRLVALRRHGELQALLSGSARSLFACSAPLGAAFFVFAPQVLRLFGQVFSGDATVLRILVVGEVVRVATGFGLSVLVAAGHERDVMWVSVGGLLGNVALTFALVPGLGGTGAAVASVASLIAVQVAMVVLAWRRLALSTAIFGPRAVEVPRAFAPPEQPVAAG